MSLDAGAAVESNGSLLPDSGDTSTAAASRARTQQRIDRIHDEQDFDDPTMAEPAPKPAAKKKPAAKAEKSNGKAAKPAAAKPAAKPSKAEKPDSEAESDSEPAPKQPTRRPPQRKTPLPERAAQRNVQFADPDDDGSDDDSTDNSPPVKQPASKAKQPAKQPPKAAPKPAAKQLPPADEHEDDDSEEYEGESAQVDHDDADETDAADDGFTDELLDRAEIMGFTEADARSYGSPEALEKVLIAMDRRELRRRRDAAAAERDPNQGDPEAQPQQQRPQQPAQQPANPAQLPQQARQQQPPPADNQISGPFQKLKLELDPKVYDESAIAALNSINDHYDTELRKVHQLVEPLQRMLAQVTGRFQAEETQRFDAEMDSFFEGLDEEYHEAYGTGSIHDLAQDAPERTARQELAREMKALHDADVDLGRPYRGLKALAKRALSLLQGDKSNIRARKQLQREVRERRQQSIARPAGTNGKNLSPERRAGKFANNFYSQRGMTVPEADYEPLEV